MKQATALIQIRSVGGLFALATENLAMHSPQDSARSDHGSGSARGESATRRWHQRVNRTREDFRCNAVSQTGSTEVPARNRQTAAANRHVPPRRLKRAAESGLRSFGLPCKIIQIKGTRNPGNSFCKASFPLQAGMFGGMFGCHIRPGAGKADIAARVWRPAGWAWPAIAIMPARCPAARSLWGAAAPFPPWRSPPAGLR